MNNYTQEAHNAMVMLTKCMLSISIVMLSFFIFKNLAVRVSIFFIAPIIIFMIPSRIILCSFWGLPRFLLKNISSIL